ncbi:hypothetical protein BDW71DRAFT_209177 [Aspergillus fruticulosus]
MSRHHTQPRPTKNLQDLRDEEHFPTFAALLESLETEASSPPSSSSGAQPAGEVNQTPTLDTDRKWCLLAQIISTHNLGAESTLINVQDKDGVDGQVILSPQGSVSERESSQDDDLIMETNTDPTTDSCPWSAGMLWQDDCVLVLGASKSRTESGDMRVGVVVDNECQSISGKEGGHNFDCKMLQDGDLRALFLGQWEYLEYFLSSELHMGEEWSADEMSA